MALLGAVDGGASDPEQVGQFGGAVLTGLEQADQMCFREKVKWRTARKRLLLLHQTLLHDSCTPRK